MSLLQSVRGLWTTHIAGGGSDYVARDSMVNRIRSAHMAPLAGGVALGTAVGAAAGFGMGVEHLATDHVTIHTEHFEATRPVLVGAHYVPESSQWNPTYGTDGQLTGGYTTYDGDYFRPIVRDDPSGLTWSRQAFVHSSGFGPVQGALMGTGIGFGAGLVLGIGAMVVNSLRGHDDGANPPAVPQTEWQKKLARAADHAPLTAGAVGTAAGGAVGFIAGEMAQRHDATLTQNWQEPTMQHAVIGYIPHAATRHEIPAAAWNGRDVDYSKLGGQFGEPPFKGQIAVERTVPTGEFHRVSTTMHSSTLTPLTGALTGAAVGALGGVATGVVLGLLAKAISGEDAPA